MEEGPNAAKTVEVVWWPFGGGDKEEGGVVIVLILVLVYFGEGFWYLKKNSF